MKYLFLSLFLFAAHNPYPHAVHDRMGWCIETVDPVKIDGFHNYFGGNYDDHYCVGIAFHNDTGRNAPSSHQFYFKDSTTAMNAYNNWMGRNNNRKN